MLNNNRSEGGLKTTGIHKFSTAGKPLISILTVVYNGEDILEQTIKSVISQSYDNIEYIIIDGGSTDKTLDVVKKYEDKIDYWISEKDSGLYYAMNKGSKLCSGDFINFLNAGDIILSTENILAYVNKITNLDHVYYSRVEVTSESVSWIYPSFSTLDFNDWLKRNLPNHQTMLFPKSFYKNFEYDTRLSIGADDDYKLSALKEKKFEFVDLKYVCFKRDGLSSNHKSFKLLKTRVKESFIRNYKHKRWIRFFIDPFKVLLMSFIHSFFGDKAFLQFIKFILRLKR